MDLKRLLIVIRRRLLWILQALVVIPCGTAYYMNQMPSIYQATAKLMIEPKDMQQSVLGDLSPAAQASFIDELTIMKTQTQLFNTKAFADRVMAELQKANPDDRSLWALGSLAGRLRANVIEDTRIIEVSCEDTDPVRAARIVNMGSEVFVKEATHHNRSNAEKARQFVEDQLALIKTRLTEVEGKTSQFKEDNHLFNLSKQLDDMLIRRSAMEADHDRAESELRQSTAQSGAIRKRLTLSPDEVRELGAVTTSPPIIALRTHRIDLQSKLWSLDRTAAESMQAVNLKRQIEQLDKDIDRQVIDLLGKNANLSLAKRIATLDPIDQDLTRQLVAAEIRATTLQEQSLVSVGAKAIIDQQLQGFPQKERQLATMMREAGALSENFKALSGKLEELRIAEAAKISPVSLIEPALANNSPVRPNKSRSMASSVFVALAVGIVLAMLVDSLDETVWSKEELAYIFSGLPVLAEFPPLMVESKASDPLRWNQALDLSDSDVAVLDVCRSLRTNLSFLLPATLSRSVMAIVASGRDEVRAKLLLSLAASYALTDKSVCVVDVDLRHPSLHIETGFANDQGLSDVLMGHLQIGSVLRSTGWPNMAIVTAGPPTLMPTELLERASFRHVIASLREKFDIVMLNAPEAESIDALVVAAATDVVLLGVRLQGDNRGKLAALREQFNLPHIQPTGLVCWRAPKGLSPYLGRRDSSPTLGKA